LEIHLSQETPRPRQIFAQKHASNLARAGGGYDGHWENDEEREARRQSGGFHLGG